LDVDVDMGVGVGVSVGVSVGEIGMIGGECVVCPCVVSGQGAISLGMEMTTRRCVSPEW
jgi:hypothetical protein